MSGGLKKFAQLKQEIRLQDKGENNMSAIQALHQLGQSLWYDNIQRGLIKDGTLQKMIAAGEIRGVTSNP